MQDCMPAKQVPLPDSRRSQSVTGGLFHRQAVRSPGGRDIADKAFGVTVYKLPGGQTEDRLPCQATGNDIETGEEFSYMKAKLALQSGSADGPNGLNEEVERAKRTRELAGPGRSHPAFGRARVRLGLRVAG